MLMLKKPFETNLLYCLSLKTAFGLTAARKPNPDLQAFVLGFYWEKMRFLLVFDSPRSTSGAKNRLARLLQRFTRLWGADRAPGEGNCKGEGSMGRLAAIIVSWRISKKWGAICI